MSTFTIDNLRAEKTAKQPAEPEIEAESDGETEKERIYDETLQYLIRDKYLSKEKMKETTTKQTGLWNLG